MPPLTNTVSDAEAMARKFCEMDRSYGVAVTSPLKQKSDVKASLKKSLFQVIQEHINTLRTVVTYAACHAVQIGTDIYLAPSDAQIDWGEEDPDDLMDSVKGACISLKQVTELVTAAVRSARANLTNIREPCVCIFILDTCRDSGNGVLAKYTPNASMETQGFSKPDKDVECVFLFSTWKGDTAGDGTAQAGHSPYTDALLEHLFRSDVPLGELLCGVEKAMRTGLQAPAEPKASATNMKELVLFKSKGANAEAKLEGSSKVSSDVSKAQQKLKGGGPVPLEDYHKRIVHEKRAARFIGREWLLDKVEDACTRSGSSPVVLILGDPGAGKSAVMAELLHRSNRRSSQPMQVWAHHFCDAHHNGTKDPVQFVKRLACLLSQRVEFVRALESSLITLDSTQRTVLEAMEAAKAATSHGTESAETLLEDFVLTPLRKMTQPKHAAVLLVDALDEGELTEGANTIAKLLNTKSSRFPSWFRIVASCRLNCVTQTLRLCSEATRIIASSEENLADVRRFIYAQLETAVQPLNRNQSSRMTALSPETWRIVQQHFTTVERCEAIY